MAQPSRNLLQNTTARNIYRVALLIFCTGLVFAALVLPIALRPSSLPVQPGDVAPQTYTAPSALTYTSELLTIIARQAAADSVSKQYSSADITISQSQTAKLSSLLSSITKIRDSAALSYDTKISLLGKFDDVDLSDAAVTTIFSISNEDWDFVKQEATVVLERIFRKTIRDYQIQENINILPSLINYSLPHEYVFLVEELAAPFIVANSLFSEEKTEPARQLASDTVQPVTRTYVANQTIAFKGQIISPEQYEALTIFGLIKPVNKIQDLVSAGAVVLTIVGFIVLYFNRRQIQPMGDLKSLTVIAVGFLVFLFGARFLVPNRAIIPYFYPISSYALILVTLFNLEIGIIFSLSLSILSAFGLSNSLDLTLFYMVSSLIGALALGKGRRITSFFGAAIAISIAGSAMLIAYKLNDPLSDLIGLVTLISVTFLNGFASGSLALLIQYILSQLLGLVTPLYLLEISRPDHPLLKFLLQKAPGTYQHSLQVSNLAEQAAEAIGADALLTRVGTLFHDVGKATNASFFVENQVPGELNTHDDLDPVIAAQIIIRHVQDGISLVEKHRLPPKISEFIREHHGTHITRYQYNRALEKAGKISKDVDLELFRYSGPRPRSKETALLMLADGCEARARAEIPKTHEDLEILVKNVFDYCTNEGQFDKTNLTLKDLKIARESFVKTLSNTYHPRIQYPTDKQDQTVTP